jgi:hypothetical protein
MSEDKKPKSHWWLLIEAPIAVFVVLPAALVSYLCQYVEVGWAFGKVSFLEEWSRGYKKKGEPQ